MNLLRLARPNFQMTPTFLKAVETSHEAWVQYALSPWKHPYQKQTLHLLGTQQVACPHLLPIDFSHKFRYTWPTAFCLEKIIKHYDIELENDQIYLIMDEERHQAEWLIQDYAPGLKVIDQEHLITDTIDPERLCAKDKDLMTMIAKMYNWAIQNQLDCPPDWEDILKMTGLVPGWDIVDSHQTFERWTQKSPEYVGLDSETESKLLKDLAENYTYERKSIDVKQALTTFYADLLLKPTDLQQVATGQVRTDGFIQQWVIPPLYLPRYYDLVMNVLPHQKVLERKAQLDLHVQNVLQHLPDQGIVCIGIDRKWIHGLASLLYARGWECHTSA